MLWPLAVKAAGTVSVQFIEQQRFADAGLGSYERDRNLEVLSEHLQALGARLPDGQVLKIEVLEVDLAGREMFGARSAGVRVMRGRADWPRMTLRYTLSANGQTLQSGDDELADMSYLDRLPRIMGGEKLAYDLRMVDDWFVRRFAVPKR